MKRMILAALFAAFTLYATTASAQDDLNAPAAPPTPTLVMGTGSSDTSVYTQLFKQLKAVCTAPALASQPVDGSLQSLAELENNHLNLAFIQEDVLFAGKLIDSDPNIDNVRVFDPLYFSELHILAKRNSQITGFSSLSNKRVGGYGGAYITARILMAKGGYKPFGDVVLFNTEQEAMDAVHTGRVDAAFIVAGQPAGWVSKLPGDVTFVPFDRPEVLTAFRGGYYRAATLRYPSVSPQPVQTLAVRVNLTTWDYKSKSKRQMLNQLHQCLVDNIDDLRETTGNHQKWREIDPSATTGDGGWQMFPFDNVAIPAPAASDSPSTPVKKTRKKGAA